MVVSFRGCVWTCFVTPGAPLSTADVIAGVLKAKGLPDDPALVANLTEKGLASLREKQKAGIVTKSGTTIGAKWRLGKPCSNEGF